MSPYDMENQGNILHKMIFYEKYSNLKFPVAGSDFIDNKTELLYTESPVLI